MFFIVYEGNPDKDKIILRHISSVDLGDRVGDRVILLDPKNKNENEIFIGSSSRLQGMSTQHTPCFKVKFSNLIPTYHDLKKCDLVKKGETDE